MKLMRALDSWRDGGRRCRMRDQEDARREIHTELVGLQEDVDDYYAAELDLRSAEDFAPDWARRTQSYHSE